MVEINVYIPEKMEIFGKKLGKAVEMSLEEREDIGLVTIGGSCCVCHISITPLLNQ